MQGALQPVPLLFGGFSFCCMLPAIRSSSNRVDEKAMMADDDLEEETLGPRGEDKAKAQEDASLIVMRVTDVLKRLMIQIT